jgi:hypothetical protein
VQRQHHPAIPGLIYHEIRLYEIVVICHWPVRLRGVKVPARWLQQQRRAGDTTDRAAPAAAAGRRQYGLPPGGRAYASAVIEILRFRLAAGTDEATFLAADRQVQQEFAYQQPGLLRRTTARSEDGGWIVIDLWRSAADADACDFRWERDPVAQAFMDLLDRSSVAVERYQELG